MHERKRQGRVGVLHVVGDHQGDGRGDSEVCQEYQKQGRVDGDGNGELRILGLFAAAI